MQQHSFKKTFLKNPGGKDVAKLKLGTLKMKNIQVCVCLCRTAATLLMKYDFYFVLLLLSGELDSKHLRLIWAEIQFHITDWWSEVCVIYNWYINALSLWSSLSTLLLLDCSIDFSVWFQFIIFSVSENYISANVPTAIHHEKICTFIPPMWNPVRISVLMHIKGFTSETLSSV